MDAEKFENLLEDAQEETAQLEVAVNNGRNKAFNTVQKMVSLGGELDEIGGEHREQLDEWMNGTDLEGAIAEVEVEDITLPEGISREDRKEKYLGDLPDIVDDVLEFEDRLQEVSIKCEMYQDMLREAQEDDEDEE